MKTPTGKLRTEKSDADFRIPIFLSDIFLSVNFSGLRAVLP